MQMILSPMRRFRTALATGILILSATAVPLRAQNAPGSLDDSFNAGLELASINSPSATGGAGVFALAVQDDGKVYLGGAFGSGYGELLTPFVRLNTDGSLDAAYNRPIIESYDTRTDDIITTISSRYLPLVTSITLLTDGKVLVGGNFYFVNGASGYGGLVRLNSDGTVDSSFKAPRFSGTVYTVALTSDDKYIVGGDYSAVDGKSKNRLVRLKSDGSLDGDFNVGSFANTVIAGSLASVRGVVVQSDGKVLVGGQFTQIGQNNVTDLARLNKDGSLDKSYQGPATVASLRGSSPNGGDQLTALTQQADSKLLIGVQINTASVKTNPNSLYRLNADGTLDTTFNSAGTGTAGDSNVTAIVLENDGKILVGGNFTKYNGVGRDFFARLEADGSLDETFDSGVGFTTTVQAIAQQTDGKILAGGFFLQFGRVQRNYTARLNSTPSAPGVTVSIAAETRRAILGRGRRQGVLTVTRTGGNLTLPQVIYYTVSGNAQAGVDYRTLSGSVIVPANEATALIKIKPMRGPVFMLRRKVVVTLSVQNATGRLEGDYAIGQGRSFVKIIDNSAP